MTRCAPDRTSSGLGLRFRGCDGGGEGPALGADGLVAGGVVGLPTIAPREDSLVGEGHRAADAILAKSSLVEHPISPSST